MIQRKANTRQWVGDLVLSGLTGLELGGGEVGFALGAQYRSDGYARTYGATNNLDVYPCAGSILNPAATCNPQTGPIGFLGSNRNVDVSERRLGAVRRAAGADHRADPGAAFGALRGLRRDRRLDLRSAGADPHRADRLAGAARRGGDHVPRAAAAEPLIRTS